MAIKVFLEKHFLSSRVEALKLNEAPTIQDTEDVATSIAVMSERGSNCLLVLNQERKLEGIITERDVIQKVALNEQRSLSLPCTKIMTRSPVAVAGSVSVARALYEMSSGGFRHLPIIASNKPIHRVLSTGGVVDFIYAHLTRKIADNPVHESEDASPLEVFFKRRIEVLSPSAPITLHEDQPLTIAVQRLKEKNIGSVMIVDQARRLTGIFTEHDYLHRVAGRNIDYDNTPLNSLMTTSPKTLLENASLSLAFNVLSESKVRHIPILNHAEELIAVVSVRNFISFLNREILSEISHS